MMRRFAILLLAAACAVAQAPAPAKAPQIPSYKQLKYPPLRPVTIPTPVQATLSNGMHVLLLEDHELPLVSGLALVRTGNLFDPTGKHGLSELMAEVMRSGGTKAKTGDQLDVELEDVAGSVESDMGESNASVSFSSLKESQDKVLGIFKNVLTQPEFRQNKLDLALDQSRSAIARRNDDAGSIPDRELASIVYGRDTPYGWQVEYADLDNIHRQDLIDFYHRYYFPKNITVAVYGDFNSAEMQSKLEKLFADWKVEQPPVPPFPAVTAKPAPGIYLAEKDDVTQTFFSIGELGGTFRDPDYAALQVAAHILGQGFSSRLVQEIRTRLGYAYNIGAVWSADYDHPGTFRIVGSTKSATTVATLQAIQKELEKMRTSEVTAQELKEAKEGVLNAWVFNFDSPAKTLSRVLRYQYFGYPKDFLTQYQKAIEKVTQADVLRVVKQHFLPENLTIVAVGNPKNFGTPLTVLGKVNTIDLTIPQPKQKVAKGDAASRQRGEQLLQRAQQALGGADKLAAVKDVTEMLEMDMDASAGGLKVKQEVRFLAPRYFRQDQTLPFGKIVAYTDGTSGWLATPQGVAPMPAPVLKQAQGELFRQLTGLLLSGGDSSRTVNAVGGNAVQISAASGENVTLEFDPATGLPSKETYQEAGVNGAPAQVVETFADWRAAGMLKMPFKLTIEQNGRKVSDAVVSQYQFNTGLKQEDLSKKP
jgi:zinc protease